MAHLVPVTSRLDAGRLSGPAGWLDDDHPFFAAIEAITGDRARHLPRRLTATTQARTAKRRQ